MTTPAIAFEYLLKLPASIPTGRVLVHNHVRPTRHLGMRGFRAWLSEPSTATLEACLCAWAPELGPHYRVIRAWPRTETGG
jgi:hypothetical protein